MITITLSSSFRSKFLLSKRSIIQHGWASLKKESQKSCHLLEQQQRWVHDLGSKATGKNKNNNVVISNQKKTILTEHVYGRTRIYTSTIAKTKATTASKTSISAPISSFTWEWLQSSNNNASTVGSTHHETRQRKNYQSSVGVNFLNGIKQNLRELFLPVGYPDALHPCYKKFHLWLGLETYVGSAVNIYIYIHIKDG